MGEMYEIWCDGSFWKGKASWAFVGAYRGETPHFGLMGKVTLNAAHSEFIGVQKATSNTAELTAIYWSMRALAHINVRDEYQHAVIHSDSKYALKMIDGTFKSEDAVYGAANEELVVRCRYLYDHLCVDLVKVKGHSGVLGNELADTYATCARECLLFDAIIVKITKYRISVDMNNLLSLKFHG